MTKYNKVNSSDGLVINYDELYYTLRTIFHDDCYLNEFLENFLLEEILYTLDSHDVIFIASDDRILLTNKGEKFLQNLMFAVELTKNKDKIYKIKII